MAGPAGGREGGPWAPLGEWLGQERVGQERVIHERVTQERASEDPEQSLGRVCIWAWPWGLGLGSWEGTLPWEAEAEDVEDPRLQQSPPARLPRSSAAGRSRGPCTQRWLLPALLSTLQ